MYTYIYMYICICTHVLHLQLVQTKLSRDGDAREVVGRADQNMRILEQILVRRRVEPLRK